MFSMKRSVLELSTSKTKVVELVELCGNFYKAARPLPLLGCETAGSDGRRVFTKHEKVCMQCERGFIVSYHHNHKVGHATHLHFSIM